MVLVLALEVALSSTHAENEDVTAEKKRWVAEAYASYYGMVSINGSRKREKSKLVGWRMSRLG